MLRLFSKCHRLVAIGSYFFTFFLNSATNIHYFFIINCIEIKLSYEYLQKSLKSLKISFLKRVFNAFFFIGLADWIPSVYFLIPGFVLLSSAVGGSITRLPPALRVRSSYWCLLR
jgi:hypothetical protein